MIAVILLVVLMVALVLYAFLQPEQNTASKSTNMEDKFNEWKNEIIRVWNLYPIHIPECWDFDADEYRSSLHPIRSRLYYNRSTDTCYYVINKSIFGDKALYQSVDGKLVFVAEEEAEFYVARSGMIRVSDAEKPDSSYYNDYCLALGIKRTVVDREFVEGQFNKFDTFLMKTINCSRYSLQHIDVV